MKLTLETCGKRFATIRGFVHAVRNISLEIGDSELFILLGPSGCGKSTLLNLVAGLEGLTKGEIRFGDRIVDSPEKGLFVPVKERNVAMVFQSYALYPHLNVFKNIAFPLEVAKKKTGEIKKAVRDIARMLEIEELLGGKPAELSGGQRQRVAIARALVRRPEVFLLDEPLSNLDVQLRASTRAELKRLQRELKITTIYVTHDQTEAMTLGDRIALLRKGALVQVGTPEELYQRPKTPFAATFVGSPPMNLIPAEVVEEKGRPLLTVDSVLMELPERERDWVRRLGKRKVLLGIRPEHIVISESSGKRTISGTLETVEPLGREYLLHIRVPWGNLLVLSEKKKAERGECVGLSIDPEHMRLYDPDQKDD